MKPYYADDWVTIYHGDCREVIPTLDPVDLVLTDPPYGIRAARRAHKDGGRVVGKGNCRVRKKEYVADDWDDSPPDVATLKMVVGAGAYAIVFGGNYFDLPPAGKWLVWDKENGTTEFADCELAWTNLPGPTRLRRHLWNGLARKGREPRYNHPTQKPVGVMAWCIQQAPDECATILDPFAGSGTTGRAAKDCGRKAILIEREERYCEVAAQRMAQETLPF